MIKNAITVAAVFFALFSNPGHAATINISPSTQNVNSGSAFAIDITISDLDSGVAPSLGVYDLDLGFNASAVIYQSVIFGSGLDVLGLGSLQTATPGIGTLNLFELSFDSIQDLDSLQPGAFKLATVTFKGLAGNSSFNLTANTLGDAVGDPLNVSFGAPANVTVLSAVPEPSTYALFGAGLLVILGSKRRGTSKMALSKASTPL